MLTRKTFPSMALSLMTAAMLAACGGGGGSGSNGGSSPTVGGNPPATTAPGTETPAQSAAKLSGIAATGAAFAGATVTVVDQTGSTVCTTQTDASGAYSCDLPAGTKAPLVVTAARDDMTLYSTTASDAGGVVNVTPLTTIIVSRLSPDGNPASLAGAIQSNPAAVSEDTVKAQVAALVEALKPLLSALGDTLDPISGVFAANGTGHDRVLDSISVSVRPDGTAANIEISVRSTVAADSDAPVSISFRSDSGSLGSLPPITAEQLAPAGTSELVANLMDRLTACFALPLTQRVRTATADDKNTTGTAADVVAPACRTLFVGDDPANAYSNGQRVGRDSNNNGIFTGLFRAGATGVKYDRSVFQYFRSNGDLVLTTRWTDTAGNTDYDSFIARNENGVLKFSGNGYAYPATVAATVQDRDYVNLPDYNYIATGYGITIPVNALTANVARVLVTTPLGSNLEFRPAPGNANMTIYRNGASTFAPSIRLAAAWKNPAKSGNPASWDVNQVFASPQYSEEQLRALPDQSAWVLEFRDGSDNVLATQAYRTFSRAPTLDEVRQIKFADLTPALREEIRSGSAATSAVIFGAPSAQDPNRVDFSADGGLDGWTVPEGGIAPTTFTANGTYNGVAFADTITFRNTARKIVLGCVPHGGADAHCDASTGVPQYTGGSRLTVFELFARNQNLVGVNKVFALRSQP